MVRLNSQKRFGGSRLEGAMAGSHVEEGGEQVRGKDSGPSTRGRKDKSRDAISSLRDDSLG